MLRGSALVSLCNELTKAPPNFTCVNPISFGRFAGIVADQDLSIFEQQRGRRRLQRKAWIFGGAYGPQASVAFALADAGYVATAFCYYFDRSTKTPFIVEEEAIRPFYFPSKFKPSSRESWFFECQKRVWKVESQENHWIFAFKGQRLNVRLELEHSFEGISAIAPSFGRPFHYTYKVVSLPAKVQVSLDKAQYETWSGSYGAFDCSLGYPPHETFWNWASLVGTAADGRPVGINVAHPFNNGLENAIWLDGLLSPLALVRFDYEKLSVRKPWSIQSEDNRLTVEFVPEAEHAKKRGFIFLKSQFKQLVGHFKATYKDKSGDVHIEGRGVVEEHYALW